MPGFRSRPAAPATTDAPRWTRDAHAQERVAALIAERADDIVRVLHDRRLPGSNLPVDHVAIGQSGVWLIDTHDVAGRIEIASPLIGAPRVTADGRNETKHVRALQRQVAIATAAVNAVRPDTRTRGALCFVDGKLPKLHRHVNGILISNQTSIIGKLNVDGPLQSHEIERLANALDEAFPPASA